MTSIFYRERFEDRFPLPFVFFEHLSVMTQASTDTGDELQLQEALTRAVKECELLDRDLTEADYMYMVQRLSEGQDVSEKEEGEPKAGKKRAFADGYLKWVGELSPEGTCLFLANYDVDTARYLFCQVDSNVVKEAARAKLDAEWHKLQTSLDAAVFGFGGGYGESTTASDSGDTLDLSNPDVAKELRGLKF